LLTEFFRIIGEVPLPPQQNDDGPSPTQIIDKYNLPELFVCFEPYYTRESILARTNEHAPAVVLDPVNPTDNIWLTLGDSGRALIDRAKASHQQLLENRKT
jgi:hypothetical protein